MTQQLPPVARKSLQRPPQQVVEGSCIPRTQRAALDILHSRAEAGRGKSTADRDSKDVQVDPRMIWVALRCRPFPPKCHLALFQLQLKECPCRYRMDKDMGREQQERVQQQQLLLPFCPPRQMNELLRADFGNRQHFCDMRHSIRRRTAPCRVQQQLALGWWNCRKLVQL